MHAQPVREVLLREEGEGVGEREREGERAGEREGGRESDREMMMPQ